MDKKIQKLVPNYKKIYTDILKKKFPDKIEQCKSILQKEKLSVLDVLQLNQKIFDVQNQSTEIFNQQHRAYDQSTILMILNYQKKKQLNNSELAIHFKLSRNTVAKWKKAFS